MNKGTKKRGSGAGLVILIALVVLFAAAFVYSGQTVGVIREQTGLQTAAESPLTAYFIDVGQGDCSLLVSGSECLLIDAGESNNADAIIEFIRELGITELTYVVATHPHSDHIGGMAKIINAFPVKSFIAPDVTHTSKTFENMLDALESNNLEITIPTPGDEFPLGAGSFTVLSPPEKKYGNLNNYSIVLKAEYGDTSILLTGDAEEEVEEELLAGGFDLKSDILKAGHHGSSTSSTPEFVQAVAPGLVIISCGADNSYGHPHKETLETFANIDGQVYQTSIHGTVTAVSDGKTIIIETGK